MRMIKSGLVAKLTRSFLHLTAKEVDISVTLILDKISSQLAEGGRTEIRGFGSFCLKEHPARIGRNPRTGERVEVPPKARVHFKPGLELRNRANVAAK